jgi:xylulokinase
VLLGIDIGTSRTKAVLIDAAGHEVAVERDSRDTPFATRDGRVEMTVDALLECVAEVIAGLGEHRSAVAGVGLAGMAESGAPLDAARHPLAPVIAWHDGRGEEAVERLKRELGRELALRIGQPVRTVLTAAKLGWLVEHCAPGIERMEQWLGVPELVLHALTGAEAIEFSQAARTGCYDVAARTWMREVGDVLGFPLDVFAPVRPAGSAMGRVSAAGSAWSGLPEGVPVTVAGHDHLAGMAGAGVRRGELANSVGTAETIVARSATCPDMQRAADLGVAVTVYPGGEEWACLVSVVRAGIVLRTAASALGRSVEELDELATAASAAGLRPVDVSGSVDDLTGGDAGSLPHGEPGEVWAGLLDALAERAAEGTGRLTDLVGPAERMTVFGGGSRSEPWLAAKSRRLPFPVQQSVAGAVARGAAVHAGVAAGWWASAEDAPADAPNDAPNDAPADALGAASSSDEEQVTHR